MGVMIRIHVDVPALHGFPIDFNREKQTFDYTAPRRNRPISNPHTVLHLRRKTARSSKPDERQAVSGVGRNVRWAYLPTNMLQRKSSLHTYNHGVRC